MAIESSKHEPPLGGLFCENRTDGSTEGTTDGPAKPGRYTRMIEEDFDVPFIAALALREKQIQQNYRPVIAVHKWFARRPGTLFRGLLLAEFGTGSLRESFYKPQKLLGLRIGDPFMGGGTPVLEANRVGCDVIGFDINPMACWIVREEIEHIDLAAYRKAADGLRAKLGQRIGGLYQTTCLYCGSGDAHVKYFLWVKTLNCQQCGENFDLFPGYLIAEDRRHPKNVLVCPKCGELTECIGQKRPGSCPSCRSALALAGPAKGGKCKCPECGHQCSYPDSGAGAPRHRLFAIEYYCPGCKEEHAGRFFKKPDKDDLARAAKAERLWRDLRSDFLPQDPIPRGDETNRLHRWGYRRYSEMFNARQLLGLTLSCELISQEPSDRIRRALATNLSDLLRYQNMLCRYDTMALKSLDVFSVHGFPVGLVQCESNLLGIPNGTKNGSVGSGGWSNIVDKYRKAKEYCDNPFEVWSQGSQKLRIPIVGEWIGERRNGQGPAEGRSVEIRCEDAVEAELSPGSLDAVFTDPPYFGNVQYAELMDFCYVWLRRLARNEPYFRSKASTRNEGELTGNENMKRGTEHFAEGLSAVFRRMAAALKPGAPLVFTFHHNSLEAYLPVSVAILDAGLTCTVAIPCPAEMGASIHISGTGSSVVDTVFVCRQAGKAGGREEASTGALVSLVQRDLDQLAEGGVKSTPGDARCLGFGHLTRFAVRHLSRNWDPNLPISKKLAKTREYTERYGDLSPLWARLSKLSVRQRSFDFADSVREEAVP